MQQGTEPRCVVTQAKGLKQDSIFLPFLPQQKTLVISITIIQMALVVNFGKLPLPIEVQLRPDHPYSQHSSKMFPIPHNVAAL